MARYKAVRDVVGTEIKKGAVIAYPVRTGSRMWMTVATVHGFARRSGGTEAVLARNERGRNVRIEALSRIAVVG